MQFHSLESERESHNNLGTVSVSNLPFKLIGLSLNSKYVERIEAYVCVSVTPHWMLWTPFSPLPFKIYLYKYELNFSQYILLSTKLYGSVFHFFLLGLIKKRGTYARCTNHHGINLNHHCSLG